MRIALAIPGIALASIMMAAVVLAGPEHKESPVENVEIEFCAYRPSSLISGSLYVYLTNKGDSNAGIENIRLDGKDIEQLVEEEIVAWYRLRPHTIPPGETGELLIRLQSLPGDVAASLFTGEKTAVEMKLEIGTTGSALLKRTVAISSTPEPVQINFVGFSKDLRKLYVYIQNNRWMLEKEKSAYHLNRIHVNGKNVTKAARFGLNRLEETVIPVEVVLQHPLVHGKPVVVTIGTKEGVQTGLTVKAFPSEFPIQITMFCQIRGDGVRDVYNHCATCIGFCGGKPWKCLPEAKRLGIDAFFYGQQKNLKVFREYWKPEYPDIKGFWVDEIDGHPIRTCVDVIRNAEDYYRPKGKFIPLHTLNIMSAHALHGKNWFELGDAITHGYGLGGVGERKDFASFAGLPEREYRQARRPFMPYFRNAEIGFEVDAKAGKLLGESPLRGYPIVPDEERFMTYGCLMQGAKGILHWGNGLMYYKRAPNWFSKKHFALRVSMGALPGNMAYGYRIPDDVVNDLKAVWDEIGRINAELQTIGPLVAISDVSNLAKITRVSPEVGPNAWGKRSAEVASLICGKDTMIVILLNMNLRTRWWNKRKRDQRIKSYEPVDVTVNVRVPPWMRTRDVFTVDYRKLQRIRVEPTNGGGLSARFPRLAVSKIMVITSTKTLYGEMAKALGAMKKRLRAAATDRPVPLPECLKQPK